MHPTVLLDPRSVTFSSDYSNLHWFDGRIKCLTLRREQKGKQWHPCINLLLGAGLRCCTGGSFYRFQIQWIERYRTLLKQTVSTITPSLTAGGFQSICVTHSHQVAAEVYINCLCLDSVKELSRVPSQSLQNAVHFPKILPLSLQRTFCTGEILNEASFFCDYRVPVHLMTTHSWHLLGSHMSALAWLQNLAYGTWCSSRLLQKSPCQSTFVLHILSSGKQDPVWINK